ncbi:MAG: ankyrin repeat domain-containing protein, partial [Planctomycetes bacterium]|nr:ankyrin repeat domain-containing protein [Planctomycetota bacterium]
MKNHINKLTALLAISASVTLLSCGQPQSEATAEAKAPVAAQTESEAKPEQAKAQNPSVKPELKPDHPASDHPTKDKPRKGDSSGVNAPPKIPASLSSGAANKANQPTDPEPLKSQVIVAIPATLDLGKFSTSEKGTGSVALKNTGDEAVTITRAKASCGCTTSDFKNGTVLQPGESTEISVTMDGKGRARKMSKTVTFTIEGYPAVRLPVVAETISYVSIDIDPVTINEETGTTIITLNSVDDQPFKVTSILPAIADLPEESSSTHELVLEWDAFWDVVRTTKMTIRLDHPLCKEITTNVRLTAEQRQRLNAIISDRRSGDELPTKDPSRPLTGDQLARYIKGGRGSKVLEYIDSGLGKFNATDKAGVTLLSAAAEAGDVETTVGLLKLGAQVERVDRVNRTPIMYAARSKNPETIQILLDAGADIQARDRLGNTPLSWASGFGTSSGVQVLIDAGADANTVDTVLGYTPLLWAAGFG